ncbi:hypothetical protein AV530_019217 [Patagioenas fasciata monilis]|uniref:Uncharacterized protein n=1 Tax=Patagioenas fasciata monilis TaxID=372326 RepID=A0A1V4K380_PATFA|nr:hypothetical protein AV530_019217 [Patagioenas fasciata monilis]
MSAAGSKYIDTEVENAINGVKQMKTLMDKTSKEHQAILHTLEETKRRKEVSEDEEGGGTRAGLHPEGPGDAVPGGAGCRSGCGRFAGGGSAGAGQGAAAGGQAGGLQRDDAGAVGGVQALPQTHLHALLLPNLPQRLGAGGEAGESWHRSNGGAGSGGVCGLGFFLV